MLKHITDITAKALIFPFAVERFVKEDLFQKIHNSNDAYIEYQRFVKTAYLDVKDTYHIENLDYMQLLMEKFYPFKEISKLSSLDVYMKRLNDISKCFLCHRNGKFALKYWSNEQYDNMFEAFQGLQKVELWNILSREFCVDILVVNYLLENGMRERQCLNGYYWLIQMGDLQLDHILAQGIAETHVHANAGIYFSTIWEELLKLSPISTDKYKIFIRIGKENYKKYISFASIFRLLAMRYFQTRLYKNQSSKYKFIIFLEKLGPQYEVVESCIYLMANKGQWIEYAEMKDIYDLLINDVRSNAEMNLKDEQIHTTDENLFLFECLKYLKEYKDDLFSLLFWKYIVIKNCIYQMVTQNDNMSGLLYFQNYFSNATNRMGLDNKKYLEKVFLNQIYNNSLKKLEIRVSPPSGRQLRKKCCGYLKDIFELYKELLENKNTKEKMPALGIIIHFIKEKDHNFFEKCWCKADGEFEDYFYGYNQKKYLEQLRVILALRNEIDNLDHYIVGIDAASVENNTEPWVFAPIYQCARDSIKQKTISANKHFNMRNLGFTYHVGEEFRHVLSGIRHVDEVIEHFGFHAGDRIGHGVALGIDVKEWCENHKILIMPRIEYLENLLWLWGIGQKINLSINYIEREIMKHAEYIYCNLDGITVYELWKAYQKKFQLFQPDSDLMSAICQEETDLLNNKIVCSRLDNKKCISWNYKKLLHSYHCKCYLERMYEVIQICVNKEEIECFCEAQAYVREKVNQLGIVVEINPTSNLAISDIERLFKHHVIGLNNQGLNGEGNVNGLIISVNSDDPVVFNTSTCNELAYIFYLLQDKGYSRESILEWIDKVRKWGLDTSFIYHNILCDKEEILKEINGIIAQLR